MGREFQIHRVEGSVKVKQRETDLKMLLCWQEPEVSRKPETKDKENNSPPELPERTQLYKHA